MRTHGLFASRVAWSDTVYAVAVLYPHYLGFSVVIAAVKPCGQLVVRSFPVEPMSLDRAIDSSIKFPSTLST
jgi:hypothetical protein